MFLSWLTVSLLALATALSLWRMVTGPTALDRVISSDVVVTVVIASVGVYTALADNDTGLPLILVLGLVGFTGAVAVARLITSAASAQKLFDRRQAMRDQDD